MPMIPTGTPRAANALPQAQLTTLQRLTADVLDVLLHAETFENVRTGEKGRGIYASRLVPRLRDKGWRKLNESRLNDICKALGFKRESGGFHRGTEKVDTGWRESGVPTYKSKDGLLKVGYYHYIIVKVGA